MPNRSLAVRQQVHDGLEWLFQKWQEDRPPLALSRSKRRRQFTEGLRIPPRRQVIRVVERSFLLVQSGNRIGDKIHIDDIDLVRGLKRQYRQPGKKDESAHHIELRGFGVPAVA